MHNAHLSSFFGFLLFLAVPAIGATRFHEIEPELSNVRLNSTVNLFGSEISAEEQFPESRVAGYEGRLGAKTRGLLIEIMIDGQGAAGAKEQPQQVRPAEGGRDGAEPGSYGAIARVTEPVHGIPFDIPVIGRIVPGTILPPTFVEVALRNIVITPSTEAFVRLDDGTFDASSLRLALSGDADVRARVMMRANDTSDYRDNLSRLVTLHLATDIIDGVDGSCSLFEALFGCDSRVITVDIGMRFSINESPDNTPEVDGKLSRSPDTSTLEIPIDFFISNNLLDNVLGFEITALGSLVGSVVRADADGNHALDAADIDLISQEARSGDPNTLFSLNSDELVDDVDRTIWVEHSFATFFGDANLDKGVKFDDFLALSSHFGVQSGWADGDFNGNGTVDFPDFLLLSRNFGKMESAMAVPEPDSLLMVGVLWPLVCIATRHFERR